MLLQLIDDPIGARDFTFQVDHGNLVTKARDRAIAARTTDVEQDEKSNNEEQEEGDNCGDTKNPF
jgi:hypothetical protein